MTDAFVDAAIHVRELQRNSEDLLDEAKLLLAHQRWARALALAVLAQEEVGKALLVIANVTGVEDLSQLKADQHVHKLTAIELTDVAVFGDLAEFAARAKSLDARTLHQLKLSALYVDARDGVMSSPRSITRERAEGAVGDAERMVVWAGGFFREISADAIMGSAQVMTPLGPQLEAYVIQHGVKAGLKVARELLNWSRTVGRGDEVGASLPSDQHNPDPTTP
jgi:AbiV family abortive infection protein